MSNREDKGSSWLEHLFQSLKQRLDLRHVHKRQTQKSWRDRNPDYFIARRIQERGKQDRPPDPLRFPPPLSRLPWDIAQDEFGVKGTDFIGIFGTVLLRAAQDQGKCTPRYPVSIIVLPWLNPQWRPTDRSLM